MYPEDHRSIPHGDVPMAIRPALEYRRLAGMLLARRWLLVACLVLGALGAAVYLRNADPVYSTYTDLMYQPPPARKLRMQDLSEPTPQLDELRTQVEMLRSPRMLRRVIEAMGLGAAEALAPQETEEQGGGIAAQALAALRDGKNAVSRNLVTYEVAPLDPALAAFQRQESELAEMVEVSQIEETRVLRIRVQHGEAQMAASIANEFARQYVLLLNEENRRTYQEAASWFTSQLAQARDNLEQSERALTEYSGDRDIRILQQNYEIATAAMRTLGQQIQEGLNKIADLEATAKAAEEGGLRRALLADDPSFSTLITQLKTLEMDRVALIMENTENHPDVLRLDRELEIVRSQVDRAAEELLAELGARRQIAEINLKSFQARLAEQEALVPSLQREMVQFRVLEREMEATREIYTALLDRSKEVSVTADIGGATVTVLREASVPEYPSSPRIMSTLALFGIFGLCCGVGLVFLADKLDRSVKSPSLVEREVGLATLATVPFLKTGGLLGRGKGRHAPLISEMGGDSRGAEAFRLLRTALQYSAAGRPPQAILISSCFAQEGKSTVAANLALAYAQRGDRVLLIDGDLKRPTVHKTFGLSNHPGLSDVLTGQAHWESVVINLEHENLKVMASGPPTPSPGELLDSEAMVETIKSLRQHFDRIIVDAAPLSGLSDALVLSRAVDGLCLVVSSGRTPMDALARTKAQLDRVGAPISGVVYNLRERRMTHFPEATEYYQYGYYPALKARRGGGA